MQPKFSVQRVPTVLAILVMLPAVVWAQTSERPAKEKLETLWEFDTGG